MRRILVGFCLAVLVSTNLSWAEGPPVVDAVYQRHRADGKAFPILVVGTTGDQLLQCLLGRLAEKGSYGEYFEPADNPAGVLATVTILPEGVSVRVSYGTNGPRKYAAWCVPKLTACEQVARQLASPYLVAP